MSKQAGNASLAIIFLAALLWVVVTLASPSAHSAGGDLGGGGIKPVNKIPKALVLNEEKKATLLSQPSEVDSFHIWEQNLTESEYRTLLVESYKMFVAPQLKGPTKPKISED